jgi:DNA polymerase (family 10)
MDAFAGFPAVAEVLLRGETKTSVRLENGLQVDLRIVEAGAFGAALQYFTGSKEHNVRIRGVAKERGLKKGFERHLNFLLACLALPDPTCRTGPTGPC